MITTTRREFSPVRTASSPYYVAGRFESAPRRSTAEPFRLAYAHSDRNQECAPAALSELSEWSAAVAGDTADRLAESTGRETEWHHYARSLVANLDRVTSHIESDADAISEFQHGYWEYRTENDYDGTTYVFWAACRCAKNHGLVPDADDAPWVVL